MKILKLLSFVAVLALVFASVGAAQAKKPRKPHIRTQQIAPATTPEMDIRGNAALGGNNANSAYGSNSANENANGRSGGGFGG